ncbi:MAG TPA: HNH endonuclease signature motif containing protein [Acidimicrobiales bacterium]|nr:HNH endonuclease signature motif containing protein [Acidimicrobiales bacterium]
MAPISKKNRVPILAPIAARALFEANRTCCVCRETGKPIQIHHIDDNPANNELSNLAVLCLDCHDSTQIRGGFGRKLDSDQVLLFKDDWNRIVRDRRFAEFKREEASLSTESQRIEFITTVAERLRDSGQLVLLAMLYDGVNDELRDKYIDLALADTSNDDTVCFLRGLQGRPDLIPDDVGSRWLEYQESVQDWSQRARTLVSLGRPVEAVHDYVRGILENLEEPRLFSAAFYLKELVERGLIESLFMEALAQAQRDGDLWWQIRALQELGWDTEIAEVLLNNREEIEASGDGHMIMLLRRAEGRSEEAQALRIELMSNATIETAGGEDDK